MLREHDPIKWRLVFSTSSESDTKHEYDNEKLKIKKYIKTGLFSLFVFHYYLLFQLSSFDELYSLSEFRIIFFESKFVSRREFIFFGKITKTRLRSEFYDDSITFFFRSHERNEKIKFDNQKCIAIYRRIATEF